MKLQDHYDWIILGNHPAALLSASLIARLGLSVLVLPLAPAMGLTASASGHFLDPEANSLIGLGKTNKTEGLILKCLDHIGSLPEDEKFFQVDQPGPQVLTPSCRVEFSSQEQLQSELQREFGRATAKKIGLTQVLKHSESDFANFWNGLPTRLTLSMNRRPSSIEPKNLRHLQSNFVKNLIVSDPTLAEWVSRQKTLQDLSTRLNEPELVQVGTGFWNGISGGLNSDPTLFDLLHMFGLSRTSGGFQGGLSAYREFLLHLAQRFGVHVPLKTECRRIFVQRGHFAGVQMTSRGNMISASGGILGCSLARAYQRIVHSSLNWLSYRRKASTPLGWRFTLSLTVHRDGIPPGLGQRSIWQEESGFPLELEVVDPKDYSRMDSDNRVLYLRAILPFKPESLKTEYLRLVSGRMVKKAAEIIPFLESHVVRVFPQIRLEGARTSSWGMNDDEMDASSKNEFDDVYNFSSLDAIPDNLIVYGGRGFGFQSDIQGLLLAADESYPELGNFGPTVASLEAVAWAAHKAGLAGPFVK